MDRMVRGGSSPLGRTEKALHRQRYPFKQVITVEVERFDPQQRFEEKERARRADEEALRSGSKSHAQLKRENEAFAFPREQVHLLLDRAKSLH